MKRLLLLLLLIVSSLRCITVRPTASPDFVEDLLARMTVDEKLGQLLQFTAAEKDLEARIARGGVGSVFNTAGAERINHLQRIALEQSRLSIPLLFGHDIIHGNRTIFPIPLGIAATWDPDSAVRSARVAAREARADGIRWTFAPMVDIARDPRWGRIAEGAGEDPFLGAAMAAAYVRGFQGDDVASEDALLACAKHFVGYGGAEAGRDYNTVDMSERTLREIYLPPFHAAVTAGAGTLMTGFNALNGVPASANHHTLTQILRSEWGFRGFVVSDYTAVRELIKHGVAANEEEAALRAIKAGVDMNMVDGTFAQLDEAVRSGRLSESILNEAVRRVLRTKQKLGLFQNPYIDPNRAAKVTLTPEHRTAAREVAQKSVVLLKNDRETLPLSRSVSTIAVVGPLADAPREMLGSWFAHGKAEDAISVLAGVRAKLGSSTRVLHAAGGEITTATDASIAEAVDAVSAADVAIAVVGESGGMTGEAASRVSLDLPGRQKDLLKAIAATGKPVVLVIMSGRPLTIEWETSTFPAVVWPWFLGTEAGNALADVLFGDVSPSGKLPVTFPRSVGQIPIYYNHLNTGRPPDPKDKYTSKYMDSPNEPLFPFGHGLSYTTIDYEDLRLSRPEVRADESIRIGAIVRNSGRRAAEEVVQLYINDPVASVSRPVKELRDFRRVALQPGQSQRVEFTINPAALAFWSDGRWTVEPGTFNVWIGPNSTEGLHGTFELLP